MEEHKMTKEEITNQLKDLETDLRILFSWTNGSSVTDEEAEAVFNKLNAKYGNIQETKGDINE